MGTRISWFFLIFLGGCSSCEKSSESFAPETLAGTTIHATATHATGGFASTMGPGYTFDTALAKDNSFKSTTTNKTSESSGTYAYTRVDGQTAKLKLTDNSELHKGETIEVTLTFTSSKLGTYSVHVLNGQSGEQNGSFELR
jgi:hypothetical protein